MEVSIVNLKSEKIKLNDTVWASKFETDVVTQAVNVYLANQRKGTSKAKTRSEVEGGGRKPWKQKGTGRARAGSIRSPIWVKGGATFAPTGKQNFNRKMNKKANVLAITMVLSRQFADNLVKFVSFDETKKGVEVRKAVSETVNTKKKTLVISDNKEAIMAVRNIENVYVTNSKNLNVYDLARVSNIIVDKNSVENLEKLLKS